MKTVITYGTFDLLHHGHVRILKRLRNMGDRLIVGLSTDEFNREKGKKTILPYDARKEVLEAVRYVDGVFPEISWDQKRDDIIRVRAAILGMGHDWAGKFDELEEIVEVRYIPRTESVSTTEIKQAAARYNAEQIMILRNYLNEAVEIAQKLTQTNEVTAIDLKQSS
ncbi:adenylyltransferase/cytidyltransferase family protein [Bradymonas sediminis]|uniref:Glycerol-3-phosphate cytidylyltransferase n=1 Tax=Bradymonas sediminis TaxID=1548548 RepID=A0A2Z4FR78_9DELT|nr:glycerol-3-phosphate cytidylyltransferase [Bradymonas sediminis]TDP73694.1 glycerol-3-phosphate cytidylyltransferase [Bradymonas sediminis]